MQSISSNDPKLIQIKLRDDTMREIEEVQRKIRAPSVSDTVRRSVGIAYALTNYAERGAKIIIETKDGEKRQITITGMD